MNKKVLSEALLVKKINSLKRSGKKIVFTNGCFDILHPGHVKYLAMAKGYGDKLVVGLNSDRSVRRIKGEKRPIFGQKERSFVLASLESVDFVTVFDEDTPEDLIKKVRPDILVKGGDWDIGSIVGADYVKSYRGKVFSFPYFKGYSTSSLIKKIAELYEKKRG